MAKRKAATKKKDKTAESSSSRSGSGVQDEVIVEPETKMAKIESPNVVKDLARQVIAAFESNYSSATKTNYRFLDDCDNDGTIERKLWPWFLNCVAEADTALLSPSSGEGEDIAFALVILSNRRGCGSAGSSGDGGRRGR